MEEKSAKNSKSWVTMVKAVIGMNIALMAFTAWMFATALFFFGSTLSRTIVLLLLLYQFTLAKKNSYYIDFLKFLKPMKYFDKTELIVEEPIKEKNSLLCYHPHGIIAFGFSNSAAFNDTILEAMHCSSRGMLLLPVSGIFARWMGLVGVDNDSFKQYMKNGRNIKFIPGGFEEATLTTFGKERVFIKERKGFIKYALQFGYTLYPVYTFHENSIYNTINYFESFRLWLNKFKLPGTLFYGKYAYLPRTDLEITTVVGKGIELPVIPHPTKEEIDKYHSLYVEKLKELFEKYKEQTKTTSELEIL